MALVTSQDTVQRLAGFSVTASGKFAPASDGTTALSQAVTLVNSSGSEITTLPVSVAATLTTAPGNGGGGTPGSQARIKAAASTNATSVKASSGRVFMVYVDNQAAYDVFLKLYNKASAPTVGTDTPAVTIRVKAGANLSLAPAYGIGGFTSGIAYAITKAYADSDTTAVSADDLFGMILYA